MADVSHELGALRFVVDSSLSSKVAMFNNQAQTHKNNQLLNPFSNESGRVSPKPQFSKDEYGKPLAGSLTEMRGQKANIHVMKEMLELCQIISSEGYDVKDEPGMRVIPFGELFNIYNYISDKVVGILLRARKHKLLEFEGEMLFQRRDDDVPIFLLRPIRDIRTELESKMEELKRASSPAPQATSVLLDKSAQEQRLRKNLKSCTPSPVVSRAATPTRGISTPVKSPSPTPDVPVPAAQGTDVKQELVAPVPIRVAAPTIEAKEIAAAVVELINDVGATQAPPEITVDAPPKAAAEITVPQATEPVIAEQQVEATNEPVAENKIDINNNDPTTATCEELPTVVIEATAVYVHNATPAETLVENNVAATEESANAASSPPPDVKIENVATGENAAAANSPPPDVNAENVTA